MTDYTNEQILCRATMTPRRIGKQGKSTMMVANKEISQQLPATIGAPLQATLIKINEHTNELRIRPIKSEEPKKQGEQKCPTTSPQKTSSQN